MVGSELKVETVNFTLMLNKLLRSNICDRFVFEVIKDFLQFGLQLFLKITLMNLIYEELLNIELDVFRDVQVIKRSIRLDRPNFNVLQNLLGIKEKRDFRTRCFSFASGCSTHIFNLLFFSVNEAGKIFKFIFIIRTHCIMMNGAKHSRFLG